MYPIRLKVFAEEITCSMSANGHKRPPPLFFVSNEPYGAIAVELCAIVRGFTNWRAPVTDSTCVSWSNMDSIRRKPTRLDAKHRQGNADRTHMRLTPPPTNNHGGQNQRLFIMRYLASRCNAQGKPKFGTLPSSYAQGKKNPTKTWR